MANARDIQAGGAYVRLFTEDSDMVRGLRKNEQNFYAWGKRINTAGKTMLAGSFAVGAPLAATVKIYADAGSALNDMAGRTGDSVESLSKLQFAAKQTGTDFETLEAGIRKLNKNIGESLGGNKEASDSFARLGLSANTLSALPADQRLGMIADALMRIPNEAQRTAATMDLLGKSGTSLLPMLRDGSSGLLELTRRAEELGLVMSTKDAQAADELGDRLDEIAAVAKRTAVVIGSALAPAAMQVADKVLDAAGAMREFADANPGAIQTVALATAGVGAVGVALLGLGAVTNVAGLGLGAVSSGLVLAGNVATATLKPFTAVAGITSALAGAGISAASSYLALGKATTSITFAGLRAGAVGVKAILSPIQTATTLFAGLGTTAAGLIPTLTSVAGTLAALAMPVIATAGIGGLGYLIATQTNIGKQAVGQLRNTFSTLSTSALEVGQDIGDYFASAFDYAKQEASKLKDDVLTTWDGITAAVAADDLQLAGQVAMAGLNVAWQSGVGLLSDTWTIANTYVAQTWSDTNAALMAVAEQTTTATSLLWIDLARGIDGVLAGIENSVVTLAAGLGNIVYEVGIQVGTHTEEDKAAFLAPFQQAIDRRAAESQKLNDRRDKTKNDSQGRLNEIELQRQSEQAQLELKQTEALTATEKQLQAAREDLQNANEKAQAAKEAALAKQAKNSTTKRKGANGSDLDASSKSGGPQKTEATTSGATASLNRSFMPTGPVAEMDRFGRHTDETTGKIRQQTAALQERNRAAQTPPQRVPEFVGPIQPKQNVKPPAPFKGVFDVAAKLGLVINTPEPATPEQPTKPLTATQQRRKELRERSKQRREEVAKRRKQDSPVVATTPKETPEDRGTGRTENFAPQGHHGFGAGQMVPHGEGLALPPKQDVRGRGQYLKDANAHLNDALSGFGLGERLAALKKLREEKGFDQTTPLAKIAKQYPEEYKLKLQEQRDQALLAGQMPQLALPHVAGGELAAQQNPFTKPQSDRAERLRDGRTKRDRKPPSEKAIAAMQRVGIPVPDIAPQPASDNPNPMTPDERNFVANMRDRSSVEVPAPAVRPRGPTAPASNEPIVATNDPKAEIERLSAELDDALLRRLTASTEAAKKVADISIDRISSELDTARQQFQNGIATAQTPPIETPQPTAVNVPVTTGETPVVQSPQVSPVEIPVTAGQTPAIETPQPTAVNVPVTTGETPVVQSPQVSPIEIPVTTGQTPPIEASQPTAVNVPVTTGETPVVQPPDVSPLTIPVTAGQTPVIATPQPTAVNVPVTTGETPVVQSPQVSPVEIPVSAGQTPPIEASQPTALNVPVTTGETPVAQPPEVSPLEIPVTTGRTPSIETYQIGAVTPQIAPQITELRNSVIATEQQAQQELEFNDKIGSVTSGLTSFADRLANLDLKLPEINFESLFGNLRMPEVDPAPPPRIEQSITNTLASRDEGKLDTLIDQMKLLNANVRSAGLLTS